MARALLLIRAAEVEPRDVLPRVHLALAELDRVRPAADLLPDVVRRIELRTALVDVRDLHRVAELQRSVVRLLLTDDHPEQRRLARAVRADHADDSRRRQREAQPLEQQLVAEALGDLVRLDHAVAEPRAGP